MGRFRALLIGIAEYQDPGIKDLPFVVDGASAVGAALESRGYLVEEDDGIPGRVNGTELLTKVSRFIRSGQRGDTLLIFLSGHGVHSQGIDYLVPSDVELDYPALTEICVPLTKWNASLESTHAASVIFLIDACREGFDEQVMAAVSRAQWSQSKGLEVAHRQVAFIFATPPGQVSRYVHSDGEEFSLFCRAVQRVAEDPDGPSTLAEFSAALDTVMGEIAAAAGKPRQEIRIRTESGHDSFVVLPRGTGSAERESWRELTRAHPAWGRAGGMEDVAELRELADELVARLASVYRKAAGSVSGDPWREPDLGPRIAERAGFLLSKLLGNPEFSPAEAALIATVPFVYAAYWAQETAQLSVVNPANLADPPGADGDRAAFMRFARGYDRLLRRAQAAPDDTSATAGIGWWIFHRWLARRPESYQVAALAELLGPVTEASPLAAAVWEPARLSELLRCFGGDPGFLSRTDRAAGLGGARLVAPGTKDEQAVRERLTGYLLAVAHWLAIEPGLLPSIVAEHLGIGDPVDLPGLLRTVAAARWEPRGHSRVLSAACEHPAVEVALREHVRDLGALLADAQRRAETEADLTPLGKLPAHASAEDVGPAETPAGRAYTDAGVRFRLDEDRVQQLLMGEQLYGDRGLAIRELYQNALDACRYRRARTQYLRQTGAGTADWTGLIAFRQGTDDRGRAYIDCTDNGIGMGLRELSEVFAQAGTRFADLPEFLEEQAEWGRLDPPVELYPNSRFGIGVLSYFMLADEITISTCRLGRDGHPGRRLQVSIAGPGNLFRVVDQGAGYAAGTTVRLYLRTDRKLVSCAAQLRSVLRVAEFSTQVSDPDGTIRWNPGELAADPAAIATKMPVWWVREKGQILADGIVTDRDLAGAFVSLSGQYSPRLSVDRRKIIGYRPADIETLLMQAVPDLLSVASDIVTWQWVCTLGQSAPGAADLIARDAITSGTTWTIAGEEYDAGRVGCFPLDDSLVLLMNADEVYGDEERSRLNQSLKLVRALPGGLSLWRVGVLAEDAADLPAVPAVPSDNVLLACHDGAEGWLDPEAEVPAGHLVAVSLRLGRPVRDVAHRLTELGYRTPDTSRWPGEVAASDSVLLDRFLGQSGVMSVRQYRSLEERGRYLSQDEPVPLGHVIGAAVQLGRSAVEVADRLAALGFRVPDTSRTPADLSERDFQLVRESAGNDRTWWQSVPGSYIDPDQVVPVGHVLRAALRWDRSAGQVAARLTELGFLAPAVPGFPAHFTLDDVELTKGGSEWRPAWLAAEAPVPVPHVLRAAAQREVSVAVIAARLTELGFSLPDLSRVTREPLRASDTALIDEAYGAPGTAPEPHRPTSKALLLRIAVKVGESVDQIDARLADLGCCESGTVEVTSQERDDALLLSRGFPEPAWSASGGPMPQLVRAAVKLGRGLRPAAELLRVLGHELPAVPEGPPDLSADDVRLLEDACGPDGAADIPLGGLINAIVGSRRPVTEVSARLRQLGCAVPAGVTLPDSLSKGDIDLIKQDWLDERWLDPAVPVPLGHVVRCAAETGRPTSDVARRLSELGYQRPDESGLRPGDAFLISVESPLDNDEPDDHQLRLWLPQERPVRVSHIVEVALRSGCSVTGAAERLRYLGFTVPDVASLLARGRPGPGRDRAA